MALVECPECKGQVSDTAKACPHCGFGSKIKGKSGGCSKSAIQIFGVIILFAILMNICSEEKTPNTNDSIAADTVHSQDTNLEYSQNIDSQDSESDRDLIIELDYIEEGVKIIFMGSTNLPTGTKLGITVTNGKGDRASDFDIFVENNKFRSLGFSSKGRKMIGKYTVELFTYFNKNWQDQKTLEKLNKYKGSLIIEEYSETFGNQKRIELSRQITFGSQKQLAMQNSVCLIVFKEIELIFPDIERKVAELENLYKNNDKNNFEIKIASWNRETTHTWKDKAEKTINNDCCNSAKGHLSGAITSVVLLGLAYAFMDINGDKWVRFYKSEIGREVSEAKNFLRDCRKLATNNN